MTSPVGVNNQITDAISSRQAQITQLRGEIAALEQAARVLGGQTPTVPTTKTGRKPMSAAERVIISRRMKASWAKRKRANRVR
jgi:hypothetical protein